jgi:hypothetical protein
VDGKNLGCKKGQRFFVVDAKQMMLTTFSQRVPRRWGNSSIFLSGIRHVFLLKQLCNQIAGY